VSPEGLYQSKIPVISWGIEPATFQLVVQYLNHLRHRMSPEPAFTLTFIIYRSRNIPPLEVSLLNVCDKAAPLTWQDISDLAIMQTGF
jgi:hypothetical protein